jgi:uncharacterized protein YggE
MCHPNTTGRLIACAAASALLCGVPQADAQLPAKPASIHATGQHELKLPPQKLRLTLSIRAEGVDAKTAIESFLAHKERVKKELVAMKAEEASIDFGATQLSNGVAGMPAEMQGYESRFIAQVTRSSPNINAAEIPKLYQAVARVRAEWPLPTTDSDALALLPETLKEQVKARDLAGEKNKAKLDGRQQEKLEEIQAAMQENMGYQSDSDQAAPFTVLFVAKVDDESRKKAFKAAYDRAVARAEMLSTVAGYKMGDLISLRCNDAPVVGTDELESVYNSPYAAYAANRLPGSSGDETQGASPNDLKFNAGVDVEFALLK